MLVTKVSIESLTSETLHDACHQVSVAYLLTSNTLYDSIKGVLGPTCLLSNTLLWLKEQNLLVLQRCQFHYN